MNLKNLLMYPVNPNKLYVHYQFNMPIFAQALRFEKKVVNGFLVLISFFFLKMEIDSNAHSIA